MQFIKNNLKRRLVWQAMALLAADGLLFSATNAANVSSFVVIIGFLLLSATIYSLIYVLAGLIRYYGINIRRKRTLSLYMTGIIAILVALQSIGELGTRDIWVLLPLSGLGWFYSAYAKSSKRLV